METEPTQPDLRDTLSALPSLPLVVGVSTRAMFDLEEEHNVFERDGHIAYANLQREREREPLKPVQRSRPRAGCLRSIPRWPSQSSKSY